MLRSVNRKVWAVIAILVFLTLIVSRLLPYLTKEGHSYDDHPIWLEILALAVYFLPIYGAIQALARLVIVMVFINRLFKTFSVQVNPLHPDGAGGLVILGNMLSISMIVAVGTAIVIVIGILISFSVKGNQALMRPELWFLVIIYLVLIPLLLIGWLWKPHLAMMRSRDKELLPLAQEFLRAIPSARQVENSDAQTIKAHTDRLAELKHQYEFLKDAYPTWPIQTKQVSQLIAISSTPLITSFIPSVIKSILKIS